MFQNVVSLLSLAVAVIGLVYLIIYVKATRIIATQSVEQTEAQSRPAVVVKPGTSTVDAPPMLVNIGNGPAMELKCWVPDSVIKDVVPYLGPGQPHTLDQKVLLVLRAKAIEARAKQQPSEEQMYPRVECEYRSLSGKAYSSSSRYDFDLGQFITTFGSTS